MRTLRDVFIWWIDNGDFDPDFPDALPPDDQRAMAADICRVEPDFICDALCEQFTKHRFLKSELVEGLASCDAYRAGHAVIRAIQGYFFDEDSGRRWLMIEGGTVRDQETDYDND